MKPILFALDRLRRETQGGIAVEFALLMPVLALLLVGVGDLGLAVSERMRLTKGVTSAVQMALHNRENDDGMRDVAYVASGFTRSEANVLIERFCECPNRSSVACTGVCGTDHKRIFVKVAMDYAHKSLFPYPYLPDAFKLVSSATVRVE